MALPSTMSGVQLLGHGGFDQLRYSTDIPVPRPGPGQVLIEVRGTSVNNTDVNTRVGWYSKAVSGATNDSASDGDNSRTADDASWSGTPLAFPRIQGADCYGEIVAIGADVPRSRIGERVLVKPVMQNPLDQRPYHCWSFGSECDGGFAQYAVAPAEEAFAVRKTTLSDEELGAIPTSYGTAEGMLLRAAVGPGDRILITGASGGVGSAAVQLAKIRGAEVIALVGSPDKATQVKELGADRVILRDQDLLATLGRDSLTCIADLVAGPTWPVFLDLLSPGGRYVVAGAIAGPIVDLDVRSLYLKDLSLLGSTCQPAAVFENLVRYIEEDKIRPIVSQTFDLKDIRAAQELFISKAVTGKIALRIPPRNDVN